MENPGEALRMEDNQKNRHLWNMAGWALASGERLHEKTQVRSRVMHSCRRESGVTGVEGLSIKENRDTTGERAAEKWSFPAGYLTVGV